MRKSLSRAVFLPVLTLLISSPAFADYSCKGPVTGLSINTSGNILAESAAGVAWGYFCSVATAQNGVDAETCKTVYAALLAAELSGQNVELWFSDSLTCTTHPEYEWLTGWYSGPTVAP